MTKNIARFSVFQTRVIRPEFDDETGQGEAIRKAATAVMNDTNCLLMYVTRNSALFVQDRPCTNFEREGSKFASRMTAKLGDVLVECTGYGLRAFDDVRQVVFAQTALGYMDAVLAFAEKRVPGLTTTHMPVAQLVERLRAEGIDVTIPNVYGFLYQRQTISIMGGYGIQYVYSFTPNGDGDLHDAAVYSEWFRNSTANIAFDTSIGRHS